MKKLIGIIFLSTVAMVTVLAAPQGNAEAWWTDFGPNIVSPDGDGTGSIGTGLVEVEIDPPVTNLWWTDHGPNH
ncbi:hypothetical protein EV586_102147 [Tumebacillus sp. BK434]|uniref:hypothetical protein n=1 Tax=Tumebacillus sp. BK434 TaxID=2512169 RepID=UPI0010524F0A|nr:hypothetical protein [Tumebacillus sp. BK434]TCP57703.1 hypothetical protein EV586_102147 [Tumebacillus sp. BK434]